MTAVAADPAGVLHRAADRATAGQPAHHRRLPRRRPAAAGFAAAAPAKPPCRLDFTDLDAPLIAAFLDHLERERGNSVRTRNARLAAIHSLFAFAALRHPEHAADIARVLAIPAKRADQRIVEFLTDDGGQRAARRPGPQHPHRPPRPRPAPPGRPNRTPRLRAHRADLRRDLHLGTGRARRCHGKGRKDRITPLTADTVTGLSEPGSPNAAASPTTRCSRPAAARRSATTRSHNESPSTPPRPPPAPPWPSKNVTPHVLRHTAAMRLLHAGVDTTVIALWLGHESVATTQIYLHADMALKQRALDRTAPTDSPPGRYQPPDQLLAFLEAL